MPKKKELTKEQKDRKALMEYLASVCTEPINYAATNAQLKRMMEENKDMKYLGIKYTLKFIKEHQGMQITGIGIVPYWYDKAKAYYEWLENVKKELKTNQPLEEKEVTVTRHIPKEVIFD